MGAPAIGTRQGLASPGPSARIDPYHPISRGLMVCAPTARYDIARGVKITPSAASLPHSTTKVGPGVLLTAAGNDYMAIADLAELRFITAFTLAGWVIKTATGFPVLTREDNISSGFYESLLVGNSSVIGSVICSGGTNQVVASSFGASQTTHFVAMTFRRAALRVYVDGSQIGSDLTDNGVPAAQVYPWRAGGSAWTASNDGTLGAFMMWNRVLSPGEIGRLNAHPFCMVDP